MARGPGAVFDRPNSFNVIETGVPNPEKIPATIIWSRHRAGGVFRLSEQKKKGGRQHAEARTAARFPSMTSGGGKTRWRALKAWRPRLGAQSRATPNAAAGSNSQKNRPGALTHASIAQGAIAMAIPENALVVAEKKKIHSEINGEKTPPGPRGFFFFRPGKKTRPPRWGAHQTPRPKNGGGGGIGLPKEKKKKTTGGARFRLSRNPGGPSFGGSRTGGGPAGGVPGGEKTGNKRF